MNIIINKIKVLKFYVLVIDNFYEQSEYELMLNECIFFSKNNLLLSEEYTKSATDKNGNPLKNNKGIFLDEYYRLIAKLPRESSNILKFNRKNFNHDIIELFIKIDIIYKYILGSNFDTTLLSYYENNHDYQPHSDSGMITSLHWLFQTPKLFSGGDLIFTDSNKKIKCMPNRVIFFPSFLTHMVTPVKMKEKHVNKQFGRFCISNFCSYKNPT